MAEKFDVDAELVRKLAGLLDETGLTEVEYESGGRRIRVTRQSAPQTVMAAAPMVAAAAPVAVAAPAAAKPADATHPGAVTSPMVGVAYLAPEPGTPAFIRVGDQVTEGQTLLLIEAMKTFNPIVAPRAGRVAQILVADGTPVEYGEVLLIVE